MRPRQTAVALTAAVLLSSGSRAGPPAHRPLRILLAEPDHARAWMLRSALEQAGNAVTCVTTWAEALGALARQPLDAVLVGLKLPDMRGLDAARRFRAWQPPVNALPLIGLHGGETRVQEMDWRAAGFDALLVMPRDLPGIAGTLRELVVALTPAEPLDAGIRAALREEHGPEALAERDKAALVAIGQHMAALRDAREAAPALAAAEAIAEACRSIGALAAAEAALAAAHDFPRGQDELVATLTTAASALRFTGRARR